MEFRVNPDYGEKQKIQLKNFVQVGHPNALTGWCGSVVVVGFQNSNLSYLFLPNGEGKKMSHSSAIISRQFMTYCKYDSLWGLDGVTKVAWLIRKGPPIAINLALIAREVKCRKWYHDWL